jgi:hypothetical protein
MAEKTKKPGFFSRYIGGLLGEDAESMTQDDRRRATLSLLGSIGRNYLSAGSGDESLAAMRASRAAERKAVDDARRTAAAEAMMPDVASRIFGGTGGRRIEELPGVGGEAMPMTARRVPTREGAMEALNIFSSTQAGRDAATMAPDLAKFATEGATGRTVGGSVYNPLTGRFDAPRTARSTTLTPAEVRQIGAPPGTIIQRDADGKLSVLPVPRAVGGGAPIGAGGVLSPDRASALGFREGAVVYVDPKTGKPQVLQAGASPGAATAGNERMRTGKTLSRDAALQYAANITGMSVAEIKKKTPVEIEALIVQRGGRVLQGGLARTLSGAPLVGGFAKTIIDAANADLMAPATSGGAGIALTQNPTGPITGADVDVGRMQFPNALYPIDVQAQMIRSILEQAGQVEEYDAKGNKVR